jgi:uncharacterized repeat protein (TIGR03803 family)
LTYAAAQSGVPYDGVSPLYGTTTNGGVHFGGVAYSLTVGRKGNWSEKVLYAFCAEGAKDCTDGGGPIGQLVVDPAGSLYGAATFGGAAGTGDVFRLSPQLGEKRWTEAVLHSFCSAPDCADGLQSESGLVRDASGSFFGTSPSGSSNHQGVFFKIDPQGAYSVVHDFCARRDCKDGAGPLNFGGLAIDSVGNFYGTSQGGSGSNGTVFRFNGSAMKVLHRMCTGSTFPAGQQPYAGLVQDSSGRWFGTTYFGGIYGAGVVFEISP